jgi:hypothetical protein
MPIGRRTPRRITCIGDLSKTVSSFGRVDLAVIGAPPLIVLDLPLPADQHSDPSEVAQTTLSSASIST